MNQLDPRTRKALEYYKGIGLISVDPDRQLKPGEIRKNYCATEHFKERRRQYERARYRRKREEILARQKAWRESRKDKAAL